ncbi:DUF4239 domain-containing protein [Pseudonocardia acaciae]|uniref:bestrophin-like domain n=1 Tax=Pseudonocardia acaciae TaxID=551276 RepID=UPI000A44E461|nr:DUF4239 domain-containing protein [Pseudonocardia acaciae]
MVVLPTMLVVAATAGLGSRRAVRGGGSDADSVGFAGGVLAALFTVVLAFQVVFAWQVGSDIEASSATEANALADAYDHAEVAPEPMRASMRGLLREYADVVANREWMTLAERGAADPRLTRILAETRAAFASLQPTDPVPQFAREQGLQAVRTIDDSHRSRVESATGSHVFNNVLLAGTVLGAVLLVAFPLLAGISARPVNVAVMALLTASLGAVVLIALQLSRPLDGPFGVEPDPFRAALSHMQAPT